MTWLCAATFSSRGYILFLSLMPVSACHVKSTYDTSEQSILFTESFQSLSIYLLSSSHLHGNAYCQNKWHDMPKLECWIFNVTKEFNTTTPINSEPQNSAVKDPSIPIQILPNQRKAGGKQVNGNHFLLSFHPHKFHFPTTPDPLSTRHHVVDEELKKHKKALIITYYYLPLLSHHQHHMIDDGHCKAFCVRFLSWLHSLHIFIIISRIDALSHFPKRFHLEVPDLFSHLFSVSKRCRVPGRGAPSAQYVTRHFHPSRADRLASSSTTRSGSTPIF